MPSEVYEILVKCGYQGTEQEMYCTFAQEGISSTVTGKWDWAYNILSSSTIEGTVLTSNGPNEAPSWKPIPQQEAIPGGNNTEIQFNDNDTLAGDNSFKINKETKVVDVKSLKLAAGTTTQPPIQLTSGDLLDDVVQGSVEFKDNDLFIGLAKDLASNFRYPIVIADESKLTESKIPVATTNGRLTDSLITQTENSVNINAILSSSRVCGKATFDNKSVVITGGTDIVVTNTNGTLFDKIAAQYVTWNGDKCVLQYSGEYIIDFALYGSGNSNEDWRLRRGTQRGSQIIYGETVAYFTTGQGNFDGGSLTAFMPNAEAGDIIWLSLTRISGNGNYTAKSGRFQIRRLNQEI